MSQRPISVALGTLLRALVLAIATGAWAGEARASEEAHAESHGGEHAAEEHGHHRHHVGVLLGGAVESDHGETLSGFALGLDYEYMPHPLFRVGALVEVATGDLRDVVLAASVSLRPWRGLRIIAAPGVEFRSEESAAFLMRVGVGYLFPVGRFSVGPEFDVDIVEGRPTYVVGLVMGVGF